MTRSPVTGDRPSPPRARRRLAAAMAANKGESLAPVVAMALAARLRSDLSLVESLNSQPIAAAIKGIFFSDRIKDRGLTNAAIRKTFDQLIVIVNLIGQHMDPGETLMRTDGHVGKRHTKDKIRIANDLLYQRDICVLCSGDPHSKLNLLLLAVRILILLFIRKASMFHAAHKCPLDMLKCLENVHL